MSEKNKESKKRKFNAEEEDLCVINLDTKKRRVHKKNETSQLVSSVSGIPENLICAILMPMLADVKCENWRGCNKASIHYCPVSRECNCDEHKSHDIHIKGGGHACNGCVTACMHTFLRYTQEVELCRGCRTCMCKECRIEDAHEDLTVTCYYCYTGESRSCDRELTDLYALTESIQNVLEGSVGLVMDIGFHQTKGPSLEEIHQKLRDIEEAKAIKVIADSLKPGPKQCMLCREFTVLVDGLEVNTLVDGYCGACTRFKALYKKL